MELERIRRVMEGGKPTHPLTVSTIAQHLWCGQYRIYASCTACGHNADGDLCALAEKYGRDAALSRLVRALTCTSCGPRADPSGVVGPQLN